MRVLHHRPLSPSCRAVHLALAEKGLEFELAAEAESNGRPAFAALDPAGEAPVFIDGGAAPVVGTWAIVEYLEEVSPEPPLWPRSRAARAECRRLADWFSARFAGEVSRPLVHELVAKRRLRLGQPDSRVLLRVRDRIDEHLGYVAALFERRRWLGGEAMSHADLMAAAQFSVVDYLGGVSWSASEPARDWYARVKSRPSFRPLLAERVPGVHPPPHYADLDF